MNTVFSRPVWGALRFFLATLAALASSMLAGMVLAPLNTLPASTHPEFFRLWFGVALVQGPALLYLVSASRLHGLKLLLLTLVIYFGAAEVLSQMETLAFNFLFQFTPGQLIYLVLSGAVTSMVLVPLVITIAGKWRLADVAGEAEEPWLPRGSSLWLRVAVVSALWYGSYMLAGSFIADPITHGYYAAKMADLPSINLWLPFLQLLRGALWTGLFILAVRVMHRPLSEAGLVAGLLFGVFQAAGLLLPSDFMPAEMRLSHLPEIVLSLVWQGCLTVAVLAWRKPVRDKA